MITACLIGVSGFGNVHYQDLMRAVERDEVRLLGATVINQEEEAEKCQRLRAIGCRIFTDFTQMLEQFRGQCDVCFIPTGILLHAPMTLAALRAGANVFVEKPAAATIQDVLAMRACSEEVGRFVAVGFQTMYAHETFWMKRAILEQQIGKLQSIKCYALWPRLDEYYTRNSWAGRLQIHDAWVLDSPFSNAVSHQLNMLCFLAGSELTRSAILRSVEAELYRGHEIESTDTACIRVTAEPGVPLYFYVTHCSVQLAGPEIIVRGDRGSIHWTTDHVEITRADGTHEEMDCDTGLQLRDRLMQHLYRKVADPQSFVCDLDIAGAHVLAFDGAYESSPIHQLEPALLSRFEESGSIKTVIEGIDDIIKQAFTQEKLFSELETVPWARPGKVIPLSSYTHFPSFEQ
ncbi:Gfo/Idh/MocA family protein [Dictyobacter aurantiacus]|uniref:Oxidoreductase n=1 Tax=Dictyobacter aurantiacus TaxID=1936993 RepID=A0A401ZPN4_9CHLR|nr:Gfo/Idh/MocA family oxidoreductase [Dictyobacter aurantiacus]GCE08821.1 oxidoreductase [Dictyobacter aurantiacus]